MDILIVISILISIFLIDNIKEETDEVEKKKEKISLSSITKQFSFEFRNLFKLCSNLNIWLLIPITVYTTFELTLIWFEFNRVNIIILNIFQVLN